MDMLVKSIVNIIAFCILMYVVFKSTESYPNFIIKVFTIAFYKRIDILWEDIYNMHSGIYTLTEFKTNAQIKECIQRRIYATYKEVTPIRSIMITGYQSIREK